MGDLHDPCPQGLTVITGFSIICIIRPEINFLENREQSWRRSKSYGLKGTVDIEWKILPDLTFSSLFSFSKSNTTDVDIATEDSYFVRARQKTMQDNATYEPVWHDGGYRRSRGDEQQFDHFPEPDCLYARD